MSELSNTDQHYAGVFTVSGEEIPGVLIHNDENGTILLTLEKKIDDTPGFGKYYSDQDVITGILNSGPIVTLFHNQCIKNHTQAFQNQQLVFMAEYLIWSNKIATDTQYNKIVCVLENALEWSGLSAIDTSDYSVIRFRDAQNRNIYHWFGAKVSFSTSLKNELYNLPRKEESRVVERLEISIESDEKQMVPDFLNLRDKIISLISFAIRNNVNVVDQHLVDFDDSYQVGNRTFFHEHYLLSSDNRLQIFNKSKWWDYNFSLSQLSPDKDIEKELNLLAPILNLYLSLFKYKDMPHEMVFLNIVQALETFHARFFYDNDKSKYVESVKERFEGTPNYSLIEKLLLRDTQMDENCNYIILVSRLNDLFIGKFDGLFWDYYTADPEFAQTIADTRHYYTHYGQSKEKKALRGDELNNAILILSLLLEYNICLKLGIDNQSRVREKLSSISSKKEIQRSLQKNNLINQ